MRQGEWICSIKCHLVYFNITMTPFDSHSSSILKDVCSIVEVMVQQYLQNWYWLFPYSHSKSTLPLFFYSCIWFSFFHKIIRWDVIKNVSGRVKFKTSTFDKFVRFLWNEEIYLIIYIFYYVWDILQNIQIETIKCSTQTIWHD